MRRIGAHTSIAGGVHHAVEEQREYGGNCGQIFSRSPRVWHDPQIDDAAATRFCELTTRYDLRPWLIHSSYLVNLATPQADLREKSRQSLQQDIDTAARLDIGYVNVHLGAHTGAGVEAGLENAVTALDALDVPQDVTVLIESDAGAGTKLGSTFQELAVIRDQTALSIGVCLDTAHLFASGYDISTPKGVDALFRAFDDSLGLDALHCIHLNDSKHACGTHKDEHAHIGEGQIGERGLRAVINHDAVQEIPLILETPTEDGKSFRWNIDRVQSWITT